MSATARLLKKYILVAFAVQFVISTSTVSLTGQVAATTSRNTLPTAGPDRPANVPDGYVTTPFGYFHSSCVQRIGNGEKLKADGRVQHADGSVQANLPVCNYLRYTPNGVPVIAGTGKMSTPEVNGWIENASITTGSPSKSYGALTATWTVPAQPIAEDGQVLFFFPGLEDINNTQSILQPVLQWFDGQWAIANWNCCLNNITTESAVVNVSPGDKILGSITGNCPAGNLSCATWTVFSVDLFTGESTMLSQTPSGGQVFNWAFGGVMEPYYVIDCSDYPPDHQIIFDVMIFDESLRRIPDPKWMQGSNSTQTPQCNYGVKAVPHAVKLDY